MPFHPHFAKTGKFTSGFETDPGWFIAICNQKSPDRTTCYVLDNPPYGRFNSRLEALRAIDALHESGIHSDEQLLAMPDEDLKRIIYRDLLW